MDRYWLLSNTCYGTWLPGKERGFVGRGHVSPSSVAASAPRRKRRGLAAEQARDREQQQCGADRREPYCVSESGHVANVARVS